MITAMRRNAPESGRHALRGTSPMCAALRRPLPALAITLALLMLAPSHAAAEKPDGLRAGAYAMDVTPAKLPISVNGNMQDVTATAVHDRLHARCLVLDDGTTRIAIA